MKMAITDAHIEPTAAIIDPELTLTCPRGLTAATAADAISHLVEGFTARPKNPTPQELATKIYVGKNRITDMFCHQGLGVDERLGSAKSSPTPPNLAGPLRRDVRGLLRRHGDQHDGHRRRACDPESRSRRSATPLTGSASGALLPYVMRFNSALLRGANSPKSDACWASPRVQAQPETRTGARGRSRGSRSLLAAVGERRSISGRST